MQSSVLRFTVSFILCMGALPAQSAVRPNVIFLMSDDQSTYSMGCYGTPGANTPHLDKLADEGIVFDNHYDTTAICMASRANVLTGMFEYKTGCNFEHGDLVRDHWQKSYPVLLREAGYRTAFAGKLGITVTEAPGKKGKLPEQDFDAWGVSPGQTSYDTKKNKSMAKYAKEFPHSTRSYGAFGGDFVTESAKLKKPFCLSISFKAPHHPVQPDPMFDDIFKGMVFSKPGNYGRKFGEHFSQQSRQGRQYERFHSWNYSDKYDEVMAKYFQQIYAVDYAVGMIREAVSKAGVADNTVIIYTSDNGFMNGSHGYGSKVLPYEESSRVPLIMFDARHANSGKKLRCSALTANVDFHPTIMELAGLTVPSDVDGKSLLPLYSNPTGESHQSLPLINVWGPKKVHSLAVVTPEWKYVYWPYAEGEFKPTEELYHLAIDPLENINMADRESDREALDGMRAIYDQRVEHWKEHAVPYHNYQPFGSLFERTTE